jgi:hypothetical protein
MLQTIFQTQYQRVIGIIEPLKLALGYNNNNNAHNYIALYQ